MELCSGSINETEMEVVIDMKVKLDLNAITGTAIKRMIAGSVCDDITLSPNGILNFGRSII